MERRQFDDLTRAVAVGTSRRGALKALAGGAAGGLAALLGARAEAAPGGGGGKPTKAPCCPAGTDALCPVAGRPTCVDTRADPLHCGGCGAACAAHQTCQAGACLGAPPAPTCADGAKNGAEHDVDCGGPSCPRCADG